MNQRIAPHHLLELTPEQQNKLRLRWIPQEGDYVAIGEREEMVYYVNGIEKHKTLPLLSLGELMELLTEYGSDLQLTSDGAGWCVRLADRWSRAYELRDALWELVKILL
ncbi:hypothetical protein [Gorillibacterium sp. sgz5001074]|uniref:hypothetical protein n=1 Tax=Gorillibacterium sp. sgz5001074 TaxID=3446695 RepID=UPI003F67CB9B